ncbi:MAG: asparagine synthase-related protein, partial [Planctomycetota bacterium]
MCGIGGILRVTPPGEPHEPISDGRLDDIEARIAWRGPDGHGRFRDRVVRPDGTTAEVALVHRRLSIIDHEGGHQPMVWTPERGVWGAGTGPRREIDARDEDHEKLIAVVFNGCIYNHRELRAELESLGHEFSTDHSDTEVLIHGWREWGGGELRTHLVGMYAFGIWDRASGDIWMARDRFGERPLYQFIGPGTGHAGWFSSTAFSRWFPNDDDRHSVERHLRSTGRLGWPDTINDRRGHGPFGIEWPPYTHSHLNWHGLIGSYSDEAEEHRDGPVFRFIGMPVIVLLSIGCFAVLIPYLLMVFIWFLIKGPLWQHLRGLTTSYTSVKLSEFSEAVPKSVGDRLDADVPIATFLSGGIDSSIVTMHASDALAGELTSICVRMPNAGYDESSYAERVAAHLGVRNHITVDAGAADLDVASDLVTLIETLGLPFGDSSILPTYWACKAARPHAKVVLSGDGGDELFLGYDRYRVAYLLNVLAFIPFKGLLMARLDRRDPKARSDKLARLLEAAGANGYADLVAIFQQRDLNRLLPRKRRWFGLRPNDGSRMLVECAATARSWDIANYLPGDLLRKVDTASMLAGVEVRCPFLDSAVADAALATPIRLHRKDGRGKYLLRQMLYERLPRELVDRPKAGFSIPIGDWFRTDFGGMRTLMMELFGDDALRPSGGGGGPPPPTQKTTPPGGGPPPP